MYKVHPDIQLQVREQWAGLGYYRRAANLLKGAQFVMTELHGEIPGDVDELRRIPGVGDYVSGAVASIAFGKHVPAVDGNVVRVITRMRCIEGTLGVELRRPLF